MQSVDPSHISKVWSYVRPSGKSGIEVWELERDFAFVRAFKVNQQL